MNENEFDRTARAWLEDGPTRMSDRAVLSALEEIHTTRQRRTWGPARRANPVNIFVRAAVAAVLVIGIGLVAINVLPRQPDGSGVAGEPTASPAASAPPSASPAAALPQFTETFVSTFNGFSIGHPLDAEIDPATVIWEPLTEANDGFDFVVSDTLGYFRGASVQAPDGVTIDDDWIDQEVLGVRPGGCAEPRSTLPEITIDGQPARIQTQTACPGEIDATVVVGRRVYEFTFQSDRSDIREIYDAYVSTIDLRPEDAALPSASPSS